jgi:transposase InsO family protein
LHVTVGAVQEVLRGLLERWGRLQRLRVDNGAPWGPGNDLPPPLMLWLIGLGILPIWNPPCRPTENAKVERTNGTVNRWAEPARCEDYAAWEAKLAWTARVQREEYPAVGGQSRLAAHPELAAQPRPYRREEEEAEWQLERVTSYLAQGKWPRYVSERGQISLYGKAYEVGRGHRKQQVWVRFDAETCEWVIEGKEGEPLRRHRAEQITAERICTLTVSKPHASSKKRSRAEERPPNVTLRYAA